MANENVEMKKTFLFKNKQSQIVSVKTFCMKKISKYQENEIA